MIIFHSVSAQLIILVALNGNSSPDWCSVDCVIILWWYSCAQFILLYLLGLCLWTVVCIIRAYCILWVLNYYQFTVIILLIIIASLHSVCREWCWWWWQSSLILFSIASHPFWQLTHWNVSHEKDSQFGIYYVNLFFLILSVSVLFMLKQCLLCHKSYHWAIIIILIHWQELQQCVGKLYDCT